MWSASYWAKPYFGGEYWGPASGSPPPPVVTPIQTYGAYQKKDRVRQRVYASQFEDQPTTKKTLDVIKARERKARLERDEEEFIARYKQGFYD